MGEQSLWESGLCRGAVYLREQSLLSDESL